MLIIIERNVSFFVCHRNSFESKFWLLQIALEMFLRGFFSEKSFVSMFDKYSFVFIGLCIVFSVHKLTFVRKLLATADRNWFDFQPSAAWTHTTNDSFNCECVRFDKICTSANGIYHTGIQLERWRPTMTTTTISNISNDNERTHSLLYKTSK